MLYKFTISTQNTRKIVQERNRVLFSLSHGNLLDGKGKLFSFPGKGVFRGETIRRVVSTIALLQIFFLMLVRKNK